MSKLKETRKSGNRTLFAIAIIGISVFLGFDPLFDKVGGGVSAQVIGASFGVLISYSINKLRLFGPDFETIVTADITILALTVSGVIGLFFGIYPAARAAKLNPIDALRYE